MKIDKPRIGLLNIGTERTKGTDLQIGAYALLEKADADGALNFIGNVESKGAMMGECDVVVADGYTGNILLKAIEGTAKFIMRELKNVLIGSMSGKVAALLAKNGLLAIKERMDPARSAARRF